MPNQNLQETHKKFAIDLFNLTWDLIEKEARSQADIDRMINAAHASRFHWGMAGEVVNIARGEWLISRVYAILNRVEACKYHASRCMQITLDNDLKDFDLAFAYQAMARASTLADEEIISAKYLTFAREAGAKIKDSQDREYFFSELESIRPSH